MKINNAQKIIDLNPNKKTIAILQLTRFGDLIQTTQAIEALREFHPEYRVVLIARYQFVRPLKYLLDRAYDEIISLNTNDIFNNTEINGLSSAQTKLDEFLGQINARTFDVLVNLSFSKSSAYLASMISSTHKIGPFIDHTNRMVINDKWSQYLYATVMRGSLNPYSLVDLFKNIIGINIESSKKQVPTVTRKNQIVVHPFASLDRKSWRPEKWVEIIYKTLKENESITINIVGSKDELIKSHLITENPLLKSFHNRLINLTGKTSIEELQAIVANSKLFVGHDSMVGHLAAITHTTSLTISLGSVRPHETTPYQNNAYNLSPRTKCFPCFPSDNCSFTQCHHDIPHQVVSASIKQLLHAGSLSNDWVKSNISPFHMSSVNFYRSQLENGKLQLSSLIEDHVDTLDIFRALYKITWSFVVSDNEETIPFPKLTPVSHRELLNTLSGLQHLFELAEFGKKYSRYILEEISSSTPSILKIKEYSRKIDEIDQLQKLVEKTSPNLSPIIDYFTVRKANLFGDNIVKLTESSFMVFEECTHLCTIMYELIENSIAEYKLMTGKMPRSDINK